MKSLFLHRFAIKLLAAAQGVLLLTGTCAALEDSDSAKGLENELDRIIEEFLKTYKVPGLAAGVVKRGVPVYVKGFGIADPETQAPVTARSLFHLASVSKTFVAAAIMQLAEGGKIDLDAPVVEYLPYFKLDDERAAEITVRQMLSHTSGMPDVKDYHWDKPEYDEKALERYVRSLKDRKLTWLPGKRWYYSNMAYEVLGDVIAKVSGRPFETYVRERILEPLEMRQSTFLLKETDPKLRTTPHVRGQVPTVSDVYPYHRAHAPSSTLHSNVEEMCNWIIAHCNRGEFKGRRILSEDSHKEMWKPHAKVPGKGRMGLGWFLAESPYGTRVLHGGRDVGFRSHVTILPEKDGGLVILINYSNAPMPIIRNAIMVAAFSDAPP